MLNKGLPEKILDRLKNSEYWLPNTMSNGSTISPLICPQCGEPEAWAYKDKPFSINCNRKNKCDSRTKTLKLFPNIVSKIEKEYTSAKNDPNRPA